MIGLCACGQGGRPDASRARADRSQPPPPNAAERAYRPPPSVVAAAFGPGGRLLIRGQADPGSRVRLAAPTGEAVFARPAADGAWQIELPPARSVRLFGLSMIERGRAIQAEGYLAVTPEGEAAQLRSGAGAVVFGPAAGLRILAIDFDRKGGAVVSGIAPPGATVSAVVDATPEGRSAADGQGRFSLPLDRPLDPGPRRLSVTAGGLSEDLDTDVSPADSLVGGPFRAVTGPAGWRIDWMNPGGGVQSTLLTGARAGLRKPAA